jgi:hypothetical protein
LEVIVPDGVRWDSEVSKAVHESLAYYVDGFVDARFLGRAIAINYRGQTSQTEVAKVVLELALSVSRSFRDVSARRIGGSDGDPVTVDYDPMERLVASGDIVSTGRGKFIYRGDFLRVFLGLDSLLERYCLSAGAKSELYPSTVQTRTLLESGYLNLSPQLAFFVAPAHLDREALIELGQSSTIDPDKRLETNSHLGLADQILAPTVCYHCFEARRGQSVPFEIVTSLNKCHRHESVNVRSLERLTTYWMRELIVIGDESLVAKALDDTFFADRGAGNRMYQAAFDLKRELVLPSVSGKRMAVASFNNHQSTLAQKFSISTNDGLPKSGCVGWGFERLIYGLYCQFGSDLTLWPAAAQRDLGLTE